MSDQKRVVATVWMMGWVSRGWLLLGLVWSSGVLDGVAAGATTELGTKVTVGLYDYSAVPSETLAEAEHEASRIFRKAGVDLLWMQCGPVQNNATDLACEQGGGVHAVRGKNPA